MAYQKLVPEVVHIRVVVPNNRDCRMGRALKAYASSQGIRSQAKAVVKIIGENKQIKAEMNRIRIIEVHELQKARDAAKAQAGLARFDRVIVGR